MKIIIITGTIGAGKSFVSAILNELGVPVYDCDSAVKALYARNKELAALVTEDIFRDGNRLSKLENALFPVLMEDFKQWAGIRGKELVAVESATMLQKAYFDKFGDYVLLITAPEKTRMDRIMARGGITKESVMERMALQNDQKNNPRVSFVIDNSGDMEQTREQVVKFLNSINYGNKKN